MRVLPAVLLLVTLLPVSACTSSPSSGSAASDDGGAAEASSAPPAASVSDGLTIASVVDGLAGPTQMIDGPDGRLWVAQLNGGENDGTGQVVAVDVDTGEREVLVDGLDKPTGIAWLDGALWIQEPTAVLRAPGDPPGRPEPVVSDMPNNGRSQGTLTPTPDGALLYETTGRERQGGGFVEGSGTLWRLQPGSMASRKVATGLKNAYAHAFGADGTLWTTEVAEPIGGVAARDELNRVERGSDFGWPACVGDRDPVPDFGGDARACAGTVAPIATFDPGATPTALVVDPFAPDTLVVALWNTGQVMTVPAGGGAPEPLVTGLPHPQHLLVDGGDLLVSDHERGAIYRITVDAGAGARATARATMPAADATAPAPAATPTRQRR